MSTIIFVYPFAFSKLGKYPPEQGSICSERTRVFIGGSRGLQAPEEEQNEESRALAPEFSHKPRVPRSLAFGAWDSTPATSPQNKLQICGKTLRSIMPFYAKLKISRKKGPIAPAIGPFCFYLTKGSGNAVSSQHNPLFPVPGTLHPVFRTVAQFRNKETAQPLCNRP